MLSTKCIYSVIAREITELIAELTDTIKLHYSLLPQHDAQQIYIGVTLYYACTNTISATE